METIKVSIIMPVYNAEQHIGVAIESALRQSINNLEIICVNDGSDDNSLQIMEKYAKDDSRVICVTTKNQGAGKARNLGISKARGKYIFFLDADDYLYADNVLEKLYRSIEENQVLVCGGSCCFDKGGQQVVEGAALSYNFKQDGIVEFIDYQSDYFYWRFLYNRKMLLENELFFPDHRRYQDPPFMLKVMVYCGKFMAIRDIIYCYRVEKKTIMWTEEKSIGVLRGICDEVVLATEMHYDKLYLELFSRMTSGRWVHEAIIHASTLYHSDEVDELLHRIKERIDINFLKENGVKLDNTIWNLTDYNEKPGYSENFLRAMRSPQGVIFYGAGIVGERIAYQFKLKYWDNVIGFAVSENNGDKREICGISIYSIDQLLEYKESANVFISTSPSLHREIRENLKAKGFRNIYSVDWAELKQSTWF